MQEAYLDINGVRTKVSTRGSWVEETSSNKSIILTIPGNPGVNGFYDVFTKVVHDNTEFPVWCIGHAGHNIPENSVERLPAFKQNQKLYGLEGQIQHKAEFIEKYVPQNSKLYLVGHSIGSYIVLELLKIQSIKDRVTACYLLFPTIEYMEETSNGVFLTKYAKPFVPLLIFLSWIFSFLPNLIQKALIHIYMTINGIPYYHYENIFELIKPGVLKRVFFLAFEEMEQVKERNNDIIKQNIDKLTFFYGSTDGWAPASYCDRLKSDIPNVRAHLTRMNHAFVLRRGKEVGEIVGDWIKPK